MDINRKGELYTTCVENGYLGSYASWDVELPDGDFPMAYQTAIEQGCDLGYGDWLDTQRQEPATDEMGDALDAANAQVDETDEIEDTATDPVATETPDSGSLESTEPEHRDDNSDENTAPEYTDEETDGDASWGDNPLPTQPVQDFKLDRLIFTDATAQPQKHRTPDVVVPRESIDKLVDAMDRFADVFTRKDQFYQEKNRRENESGRSLGIDDIDPWYLAFSSINHHNDMDPVAGVTNRDGASWRQQFDYEGTNVRPGIPKLNTSSAVKSEHAALVIARKTDTGITWDQPLYASGIWLRFKTPTNAAKVVFQQQLDDIKVTLGAETKGLAHSAVTQKRMNLAVDFALQHVIRSNVPFQTPTDLKEKILLTDAPDVLTGLAVTMFPNGFNYTHPCIADPETCNHVEREILNLKHVMWVDTQSLTQLQKQHMAKRLHTTTDEALERYRNETVAGQSSITWLGDDIGVRFRVPTLIDYEQAGDQWVADMIELTHGAFNEPPGGSRRDSHIQKLGDQTTARQWEHYVDAIMVKDDDGDSSEPHVISESEQIRDILQSTFSKPAWYSSFEDAVTAYTDRTQVTVVAVNAFNCPQCGTPQGRNFYDRPDHLVRLDPLSLFFTLVNLSLT